MEAVTEQDHWCRTTFGDSVKTNFTWTIENFKNRPENYEEYIKSSSISVTDSDNRVTKWFIFVFPKGGGGKEVFGEDKVDYKDCVSVYLASGNDFPVMASLGCCVLDRNAKKMNKMQSNPKEMSRVGYSFGFPMFLRQSNLNGRLLQDGNLTLAFEVTVYGKGKTVSGSKDNYFLPQEERRKQLSDHFGQMLEDKDFSDVEIHCNGKVFSCHQSILAARSSVFRAMLQAEMREAQTKRIDIQDSRPEIVGEMLRFIYTGDISDENLTVMATDLLRVADMYELDFLRKMCEANLCSSLKVENSIEYLVLGDMYHAPKLKKKALELVAMNMKKIVDTDVYKDLLRQKPDLAWEVNKAKTLEADES